MKQMTSRDIAKIAGVSPAAVSFAINGKKGISEQTRKHILDIIAETNYQYVPVCQRTNKRTNIALLFRNYLPTLDKLFYTELNNSVMQACDDPSIALIMASIRFQNNEVAFPDMLFSDELDGVIIFGDLERRFDTQLGSLRKPIVVLDSSRHRENQLAVYVDYAHGAYLATEHLIQLGHKDIAYLGNDRLHDFNLLTFSGFQRATAQAHLALSTDRIQLNVYDEQSLTHCIDNVFGNPAHCPTAIFCSTDCYAIHAIRRLHALKLRVPEDVSVVGIDDIVVSSSVIPALTTVRVDRDVISRLGLDLLMKRMRGEPCESVTVPLDDLIMRETTAPPRIV